MKHYIFCCSQSALEPTFKKSEEGKKEGREIGRKRERRKVRGRNWSQDYPFKLCCL
jgi:hypothetical protein